MDKCAPISGRQLAVGVGEAQLMVTQSEILFQGANKSICRLNFRIPGHFSHFI